MEFLKANTQLSYTQIYKWGWDQKKKVERNPNAKKVPTIDEFGGYCKFEASQKQSISKVLDIDWNEKIRLLDLECEREEMQMKAGSVSRPVKRVKTHEITEKVVHSDQKAVELQPLEFVEEESMCTPPKKPKRQRYCSDATNATRGGQKKKELVNTSVNPYINFTSQEEDFESIEMGTPFLFAYSSFKYENQKVGTSLL